MCVTAGTATPVYAVETVAEQSMVEENTGNVEENQEQEKAPENNGENFGEENSGEENSPEKNEGNPGEVKAPENSGVNSGEVKAPENSGANSGGEKAPENGSVNSGEGKDTENSGENADEEEKSGEVAEVPEDELDLQELGEENQIAAFSEEETLTVTDLTELISALNNENCKKIVVNGSFDVTQKLTVNRELTIYGGTSGVTLNRGDKGINLFYVESSGKLTLENITIDGKKGTYKNCNPLIYTKGTLTLEKDAVLQNNHAQYVGSAIQAMGGSLIMNGGFIQDNETAYNGGGIYLGQDATFKMTGGTIQRNTGDGGGGIDAQCLVTMTGGTIQKNTATRCGGGIMLNRSGVGLVMSGGSITENHAKASSSSDSGNGGGVYANTGAKLTLSNGASIENNTAEKNGGGVYAYSSATLTLNTGATIGNNTANTSGGGIASWGTVNINGGTITNNTSSKNGGGIFNQGQVTMTAGQISGNQSTKGSGGGIASGKTVNINGGKITNNTSFMSGGGIYNENKVTMTAGEISDNHATTGYGGGIYNLSMLLMSGGNVTGNTANSKGGGIYQGNYFQVSGETVQITGNTVNGGNASNVFLNRASDGYCYYVEIASSGLSGNSKMGVSIGEGKDLNITQAVNDADYSKYFTSDDSNYEVVDVAGSDGKHQLSLKKTGSGNTGGSESGGSAGGNTGGSESGGSTGGNTGGSESGGTTGGNNGGNTSGSTTGTSTGTSGGSSAGTATVTPATTTPKETTITVPLQADTQKSTLETGNLPTNLQQRVLNQKISHTVLSSAETGVKVGLDIEAVRSISGQAQGDASVVVQKLDNTALKGSAAAVIGTRPVVTVWVQDAAGKAITDLGAGSVLVEIPYVLQNGENPGNICAVSTDAEGNVQWILNSVYDSEKQVLRFRTLQGADYGVASIPVGIYQDIVGTDKQADIAFAVSRGLLTGDAKGQAFNPEKAVTMEEFANALDRMTGKKVSDVVLGNFVPTQSITREDMAVLLVKYADTLGIILPKVQTANAFADQNRIQTEALSAVQLLQQAEVLVTKVNQNFAPKEEVTRAECCTTLRLFMEMMVKGTCRTN